MLNIKSLIRLGCLSLIIFYCVPSVLLAQSGVVGNGSGKASGLDAVIDVIPGGSKKFRIAVSELAAIGGKAGSQTTELPTRLEANLDMTGLFININRSAFLETDPKIGVEGQSLPDFQAWTRIGADFLVKGGISTSGSKITLDMRLYDAGLGKLMLNKRYSGSSKEAKKLINQFTNDLLEAITGTPGFLVLK